LVTDQPGFLLGVLTADCAPVLFHDAAAGVIGGAHAGWKGAIGGVTDRTVEAMEALGADRARMAAVVGPCIAQASYEVDAAFEAHFTSTDPETERFFKAGCAQCHHGPRLTDDAFHVIRFPTGAASGVADRGRQAGVPQLLMSEFTAAKAWSDSPASAKSLLGLDKPPATMLGAFKTPTLRGLPKSGPYGHGGTFATLAEVTKHYGERGLKHDDTRSIGATEAWVPLFDTNAQRDLVPLLEILSGDRAD
jgi:hypothetical protein